MKKTPTRTQRTIARRLTEVSFFVPLVVAQRAGYLAMARTPARAQRELNLMVSEKFAAFSEAWMAMAWRAMLPNADMLSVLSAGLAPVHRRTVANAKRLSR